MIVMLIYKIVNLLNGKIYVGQTTRGFEQRISEHRHNTTSCIGQAIQKYGWENFKAEIIEYCSSIQELCEREKFWIEKLNSTFPNGYNVMKAPIIRKLNNKIRKIVPTQNKFNPKVLNITACRLRSLRKKSGLSQQKVANAIGITRTAYNKYESGVINPVRKLNEIAALFGVNVDYILGREGITFGKFEKNITPQVHNEVKKYLNLSNEGQEIVNIMIDALYEREKQSL